MEEILTSQYFPFKQKLPQKLFLKGDLGEMGLKRIAIVGARRPSRYGLTCVASLIGGLSGFPVSIVSGLALGIDSAAHDAALKNKIHTIALPGSGIDDDVLYPRTNLSAAKRILASGGALLSQWEKQQAAPWTFPVRNAVMAGISDIVIIIEAQMNSGTMITAKEAMKRNIPLGAVPGNIDSLLSVGPNTLLQNNAHCICSASDILRVLGIDTKTPSLSTDTNTHPILSHLISPLHRDELAALASVPIHELNAELTLLEISGLVSIDSSGVIRKL